MKKILALIIAVLMCVTLVVTLCACTPKNPDRFEGVGDGKGDGTETRYVVKFYSTMGKNLSDKLDAAIKDFNKIYPNIKIEHDNTVNNYDTLKKNISTELKTNSGPCVAYCYPDHVASYNNTNKVIALNKYIESTETVPVGKFGNTTEQPIALDTSDFVTEFYNEGKDSFGPNNTKMYTLPFAKSSEVMFCNNDFFVANNLQVPTHWWCTAETAANADCGCTNVEGCPTSMETICKKIKEIDPDCVPLGYDSDSNLFITMCEQVGAEYTSTEGAKFLFNNEKAKAFVRKLNEWYRKGWLLTQGTNDDNYTSKLFTAIDGQKVYMCIGSTGGATYQIPEGGAFEVKVAPIPQHNPAQPKVISQGPNLCMLYNKNNNTPDQQLAAWLWIRFMTTNLRLQAGVSTANGYAPVTISAQTDPTYVSQYLDKANGRTLVGALAVKQCIAQANAYYTSPAFNGSSVAREQVGIMLANCLQLTGSVEQVNARINEIFAQAIELCQLYSE